MTTSCVLCFLSLLTESVHHVVVSRITPNIQTVGSAIHYIDVYIEYFDDTIMIIIQTPISNFIKTLEASI